MHADPLEQHDLIGEGKHETRFKRMHDRLFDWIETNGGIPIPLQRTQRGNTDKKRPKDEPKTVPDDIT